MAYAIENALFQWEEGERRVRDADPPQRTHLERATAAVHEGLRRRLGGEFSVDELAALYGGDTDWATGLARAELGATDAAWAVEAAFGRYAREAFDYAGGRARRSPDRS